MSRRFHFCTVFLLVVFLSPVAFAAGKAKHFVLVVWDGMRPDYVSPELTPALWSLRRNGVWFANHHSTFPTSTQVNGAVLATGASPQRSGIVANREFRPHIDPLKPVDIQSLRAARRGDELSGGKYIAVPTLAERVQARGFKTAVAGSKAVALLHDRKSRNDSANPVWFADGALPESFLPALTERFGRFPEPGVSNAARDEWTTRVLIEDFWKDEVPRYSVLWLSEPDASQHRYDVGTPNALDAIRSSDALLAKLLNELDRRGVREQTDIIVVSDHGFSTVGENADVPTLLRAAGINVRTDSNQPPLEGEVTVVSSGGVVMFYVAGHSPQVIRNTVEALQRQRFTGVVFTRDALPGTFPLAEAQLASSTAPDIVVAMRWTPAESKGDHPMAKLFNNARHVHKGTNGMHASLCPLDLRNTAVACGPDFKRGVSNPLPSGNIDIVPTLLWLMNIKPRAPLDGRVLSEALTVKGPPLRQTELGRREAQARLSDGVWAQHLTFTEINGVRYLSDGNGSWTPHNDQGEAQN